MKLKYYKVIKNQMLKATKTQMQIALYAFNNLDGLAFIGVFFPVINAKVAIA
jgi:hypothetical protein